MGVLVINKVVCKEKIEFCVYNYNIVIWELQFETKLFQWLYITLHVKVL